jgi:enoyl-CoA hydratase/carnithine racemase
MSNKWFADLEVVLRDAGSDSKVRCIHLSAEGKSFSNGGDIDEFLEEPFPTAP